MLAAWKAAIDFCGGSPCQLLMGYEKGERKLVLQTTLLENLFSNTQEKGTPSIVSDRKPQPGITRQDHHKQRTTKMTCYSKMTQEMRHKIVTNNGFLPKCITPFPNLLTPKPKFALQRTRGGAAPHHPPFLSPHPPTLFCYHNIHPGGSNIAVLQDK
jgi:hypothetical protein